MWRRTMLAALSLVVALALVIGCGTEKTAQQVADIGVAVYTDSTLDFPPMQYSNGQVTINDRCPVRKVPLNRSLTPIFVNGKPLGFC